MAGHGPAAGKFTKWNNNAGAIMHRDTSKENRDPTLGAISSVILEDDEDDDDDDDDARCGRSGQRGGGAIEVHDVPQAFSHFSFEASQQKKLVCDLQVCTPAP
jgi:hypothetical protein